MSDAAKETTKSKDAPKSEPKSEKVEAKEVEVTPEVESKVEVKVTDSEGETTVTATQPKQGRSGLATCLIVFIGALLALCCLCSCLSIALFMFAPDTIRSILVVKPAPPAAVNPPLTETEVDENSGNLEDKLDSLENNPNSEVTMTLSEDELLAAFLKNTNIAAGSGISFDIKDGSVVLSLPVDQLFAALTEDASQQEDAPLGGLGISGITSLLGGSTIDIELVVSDNGRGLALKSVSTGVEFIDTLLNDQILNSVDFARLLTLDNFEERSGFVITNIDLNEDEAVVQFVKTQQ